MNENIKTMFIGLIILCSLGSQAMQSVNEEDTKAVMNKFPDVGEMGYGILPENLEEKYKCQKVSVERMGYFDNDGEELEILNINFGLAKRFSKNANTVNLKYFRSIEQWNSKLKKFYLSLFKNEDLLTYVYHTEGEKLYLFKFDDIEEFEKEVQLNLDNKYTDSLESDWERKTWLDAFDSKPSNYTQLMLGLEAPIGLIFPSLGCILIHSKNKSIEAFCKTEIPAELVEYAQQNNLFLVGF